MNIAYKKVSALVFSAIITTSMVGMENENMVETTEQVTSAAWYRKGSVQAVAVAITLAAVGYVCAVRMGKAVVPAFAAALFTAKLAQDTAPKLDSVDEVFGQITPDQNQDIIIMDASEPKLTIVWNA